MHCRRDGSRTLDALFLTPASEALADTSHAEPYEPLQRVNPLEKIVSVPRSAIGKRIGRCGAAELQLVDDALRRWLAL